VVHQEQTPYPGINRTYDKVNQAEDFELPPAPSVISHSVIPPIKKFVGWARKALRIKGASALSFNDLPSGKISISVPGKPAGQKLIFRTDKYYIPGTRYNPTTMPSVVSRSLRWKAIRGLGVSLGISVVSNLIDFTWGENKNKGVRSNEFAASTMIDFVQAGVIGIGSALLVGGALVATSVTIPLLAAAALTAGVGYVIGLGIDQIIDTKELKDRVANGLSALGGAYQNAKIIVRVGTERLGERVNEVSNKLVHAGKNAYNRLNESIRSVGDSISNIASKTKDKVSNFFGNLFGGGN
jgi:hypothetical protein